MRSTTRRFLLIAALSSPLTAQAIVNIESIRLTEPEPGWNGQVEWAFGGRTGNVEKQNIDAALRIDWQLMPYSAFLILQRQYGKAAGIRNEDSTFIHLRAIHQFTPDWAAEAFLQQERDDFRRLKSRSLAGVGGRFRLATEPERLSLHLGLGFFHYQESLEPLNGSGGNESGMRVNSYLAYTQYLNDQLSLASTTYIQPKADDLADIRTLEQAAAMVKMGESVALQLGLDVVHDSKPPAGVQNTDVTYKTSLIYRF